ncbi:MAG: thioredoxin [Thermoplasmatales archaeon]|nr:thioredoxin [Thermoplasmatales archaeon]
MVEPKAPAKGAAAPAGGFPKGEPATVTDANFDAFVASEPLALVDCWAPWCGPCRRIAPIIDALAKDSGGIAVGKLNTDENRGVMMRFRIEAIPTILMFKDGKLADTVVGLAPDMSAESLKKHMMGL